jgi:hypothetical protein
VQGSHGSPSDNEKDDPLGRPIPDGIYKVAALRVEVGRIFDRDFRATLCRVTDGPFTGRIVVRFYNPPRPGRRLARSSALWRDFVVR